MTIIVMPREMGVDSRGGKDEKRPAHAEALTRSGIDDGINPSNSLAGNELFPRDHECLNRIAVSRRKWKPIRCRGTRRAVARASGGKSQQWDHNDSVPGGTSCCSALL